MGRSCLCLMILLLLCPSLLYAEDPVVFVDENLKAAVEEELWVDDPTPTDMLDLLELRCIGLGIEDITGLEYATNLETLWVRQDSLSDVSPLAGCTQMVTLNLSQNKLISDLSPLADMVMLNSLDCHRNKVSDLSFTEKLVNLESLILRWNEVSDLSDLSHLIQLKVLRLEYNQVEDLTPLQSLVGLTTLDVSGNAVTDLSPLAYLSNLEAVYANSCLIEDVNALATLTDLRTLKIRSNQVSDIYPLCGLYNLSIVTLTLNPLNTFAYEEDLYTILENNPGMTLDYSGNWQGPDHVTGTASEYGEISLSWDEVPNGPHYTSYYRVYRFGPLDEELTAVSDWQTDTTFEEQVGASGSYEYYIQCAVSEEGSDAGDLSEVLNLEVALISSLDISSGAGGTVTSPGEGLFSYDDPVTIVVSAEPLDSSLYEFSGWSGTAVDAGHVDDVNAAVATVLVDGYHTLVANFSSPEHDLYVSSSRGGQVTSPGEGAFIYTQDSEVVIEATPEDESYRFVGWTGTAVTAGKVSDSTAALTTVFVDNDYSLYAHFAGAEQYFMEVVADGEGTVTGTGSYEGGSEVAVSATAGDYYDFDHWTVSGDITIVDANTPQTTAIVDGNGILTAHFVADFNSVMTVSIGSGEGGTVERPGESVFEYPFGYQLVAYAQPNPGYYFNGWYGDIVSAENPLVLTVESDLQLIATFSSSYKTLEVGCTAGGRIVEPSEETGYPRGLQVAIQAEVADANLFVFSGWIGSAVDAGWVVEPNQLATSVIMKDNCSVTATFKSLLSLIHVDDDAPNDPGPGQPDLSDPLENGTRMHPLDSIQKAIDVADEFVTIMVQPGTYYETLDFKGKNIKVIGFDPNSMGVYDWPVIDANQAGTVVTFANGESSECLLAGFTLTGGYDNLAGAVRCVGASPRIQHCVIAGNRCSDPNAEEALSGDWMAAILYCEDSNSCFMHCTVADNYAGDYGRVALFNDCPSPAVINSIFYHNEPAQIDTILGTPWFIRYTNVEGGWPGLGNKNIDPLFASSMSSGVEFSEVDYHLQSVYGRWNPETGSWEIDLQTSSCVTGASANAWNDVDLYDIQGPMNYGAYGGTLGGSLGETD